MSLVLVTGTRHATVADHGLLVRRAILAAALAHCHGCPIDAGVAAT